MKTKNSTFFDCGEHSVCLKPQTFPGFIVVSVQNTSPTTKDNLNLTWSFVNRISRTNSHYGDKCSSFDVRFKMRKIVRTIWYTITFSRNMTTFKIMSKRLWQKLSAKIAQCSKHDSRSLPCIVNSSYTHSIMFLRAPDASFRFSPPTSKLGRRRLLISSCIS